MWDFVLFVGLEPRGLLSPTLGSSSWRFLLTSSGRGPVYSGDWRAKINQINGALFLALLVQLIWTVAFTRQGADIWVCIPSTRRLAQGRPLTCRSQVVSGLRECCSEWIPPPQKQAGSVPVALSLVLRKPWPSRPSYNLLLNFSSNYFSIFISSLGGTSWNWPNTSSRKLNSFGPGC